MGKQNTLRGKEAEEGSLLKYLRTYPLKEAGSPVLLYNGSEKENQSAHAAVFAFGLSEQDRQQCADSIMKVYAEFFYHTEQYERIQFHFISGFLAEYVKWREGYRVSAGSGLYAGSGVSYP